nr:AMP-binding protein [Crenobacter caeni]
MHTQPAPLWQPSAARVAAAHLTAFTRQAEHADGRTYPDYESLRQASIDDPGRFWRQVWDYCGVIGKPGEVAFVESDEMRAARFFPNARLNYAENLLRHDGNALAVAFWGEDRVKRELSFRALRELVSRLQQALRAQGVRAGDRVAGFMPNMPETLAAMLATASLGAIWTSCSPDFGADGAIDRFGQTAPKVLFCPDAYFYNGKRVDIGAKLGTIARALPSLERLVVVPYTGGADALAAALPGGVRLDSFLDGFAAQALSYERVGFNHPLFILYSSGTTGAPKCIVHGHGGTLLQHLKEHQLHADLHQGDVLFYFSTCGWMMWNWLASGLASGATLLLFDGSPFAKGGRILWEYADAYRCTHFGTSAKYLDGLGKVRPGAQGRLRAGAPARADVHRLAAAGRALRLGLPGNQGRPRPCVDLGRYRHPLLLRAGQRLPAGLPRPVAMPGLRHGGRGVERRGKTGAGGKGRTGMHPPLPVDAGRLLERRGRREVPQSLLRALPWCLVPRRLRRADGRGRPDHPRPLRRGAQPRRRAHRHRRDLPAGRTLR